MVHRFWVEPPKDGKDQPPAPLLTVAEVAKQFRVHEDTVAKLVKQKKLRAIKVEGQWRFRQADVDRYLTEQENVRSA